MAGAGGEFRVLVRTEERGRPCPEAGALQEYFSQFGVVLDVYKPVRTLDVAYITLNDAEELQAALFDPRPVVGGVSLFLIQANPRGASSASGPPRFDAGTAAPSAPVAGAANWGAAGGWKGGWGAWDAGGKGKGSGRPAAASPAPFAPASSDSTRIYVAGVEDTITDEMLQMHFSHFGVVKDVYVPVDKTTGLRKPFAFVTMTSADEVAAILALPPTHLVGTAAVNVTPAMARGAAGCGSHAPPLHAPRGAGLAAAAAAAGAWPGAAPAERPKQGVATPWRLFVWGMPQGLNADMLRGHFAHYGEICDIYIPASSTELAYVTFSAREELEDALLRSGMRIAGYTVQGIKQAEARKKGAARPGPY